MINYGNKYYLNSMAYTHDKMASIGITLSKLSMELVLQRHRYTNKVIGSVAPPYGTHGMLDKRDMAE